MTEEGAECEAHGGHTSAGRARVDKDWARSALSARPSTFYTARRRDRRTCCERNPAELVGDANFGTAFQAAGRTTDPATKKGTVPVGDPTQEALSRRYHCGLSSVNVIWFIASTTP